MLQYLIYMYDISLTTCISAQIIPSVKGLLQQNIRSNNAVTLAQVLI